MQFNNIVSVLSPDHYMSSPLWHGHIDGLVLLSTWQGTAMYANIVDGVLHGPAFATLRQPVFDIWVGQGS